MCNLLKMQIQPFDLQGNAFHGIWGNSQTLDHDKFTCNIIGLNSIKII